MTSARSSGDYAGDLSIDQAWALLESEPAAQLFDVRTTAEWSFVGVPDLGGLGKRLHCIEWQSFPSMAPNPDFVAEARPLAGPKTDAPLLFLCRSGGRSRSAAMAMAAAGYTRAYNIAGGFEGDLDKERHRGQTSGWKATGLPWKQT